MICKDSSTLNGVRKAATKEIRKRTPSFFDEWWLMSIENNELDVTLEDMLIFVTGADSVPPLGFPHNCEIQFYDQEPGSQRIPYYSTTALILYLPRSITEESMFKDLIPDSNIVSAQIRPTPGPCEIHVYQMWAGSGPTPCCWLGCRWLLRILWDLEKSNWFYNKAIIHVWPNLS
ncbi:hypothetical protein PO909_029288 [Leuciscus waleckii]